MANKHKITIVLLGVALHVIAGCATTSDVENLRNNMSTIHMETVTNKKDISELKSTLVETSRDVTALKERTEGVVKEYTLNAIREGQANLLTQISDLSRETQTLKGRFDENKYFMDKLLKDLLSEREVMQAKITSMENEIKELRIKINSFTGEKKESPKNNQEAAPADVPAETNSPSADNDPQRLYDDSQIAFKEKKYADARQKFESFTKDFPAHPLTPNAYFWLGETYYADKKFEDAILAYETFVKKYPNHEKNRSALLKQAYSFIEIGDRKTGKVLLEKVIEKYPKSPEAGLAEKKIQELGPKAPVEKKKTR